MSVFAIKNIKRNVWRLKGRQIGEYCAQGNINCCIEDIYPSDDCETSGFRFPDTVFLTFSEFQPNYLSSYPIVASTSYTPFTFGSPITSTTIESLDPVTQGLITNSNGFQEGTYRLRRVGIPSPTSIGSYILSDSINPFPSYPNSMMIESGPGIPSVSSFHGHPIPYLDGDGNFIIDETWSGASACDPVPTRALIVPWPSNAPQTILLSPARYEFTPNCNYDLIQGTAFCSFFGDVPLLIQPGYYDRVISIVNGWNATHVTPFDGIEYIMYGVGYQDCTDPVPPPAVAERRPIAWQTKAYCQIEMTFGCPEQGEDGNRIAQVYMDMITWGVAKKSYTYLPCPVVGGPYRDHIDLMMIGQGFAKQPTIIGKIIQQSPFFYSTGMIVTEQPDGSWYGVGDVIDIDLELVVGKIEIST